MDGIVWLCSRSMCIVHQLVRGGDSNNNSIIFGNELAAAEEREVTLKENQKHILSRANQTIVKNIMYGERISDCLLISSAQRFRRPTETV